MKNVILHNKITNLDETLVLNEIESISTIIDSNNNSLLEVHLKNKKSFLGTSIEFSDKNESKEKTHVIFTLVMQQANSWNGKWSGENKNYTLSRKITLRGRKLYPKLKEGNYYYEWEDGWKVRISAVFVTKAEAERAERKSDGFLTYEWMIDSILKNGYITTTI